MPPIRFWIGWWNCILNRFVDVRYHAWWPSAADPYYVFNTPENRARINYYPPHPDGYYYASYVWIDGIARGGYNHPTWWNMIQGRSGEDSPLEIKLTGTFSEATRQGSISVRIIATDYIDWQQLKLRLALTESNLNWHAPNGTTVHNSTMRDMIPTAVGTAISIAQGETLFLSQAFTCSPQLVLDNCDLIAWVQVDAGREVLQTATISLPELLQPTGIDDVGNLPNQFALSQNYPNPFNARTTINYTLDATAHVRLTVYDLAGRAVVTLQDGQQTAGRHRVNWNGLDHQGNQVTSGIYYYRLEAGQRSATNRMLLLK